MLNSALLKTPNSKSTVRNFSSVTILNSAGFQYPAYPDTPANPDIPAYPDTPANPNIPNSEKTLGKNEQPLQKGSKKFNAWLNSEHLFFATDFYLFNVTDPDHVIG